MVDIPMRIDARGCHINGPMLYHWNARRVSRMMSLLNPVTLESLIQLMLR